MTILEVPDVRDDRVSVSYRFTRFGRRHSCAGIGSHRAGHCPWLWGAHAEPLDGPVCRVAPCVGRADRHEPEVVERLQRILRNARDIKQTIQQIGQKMTPLEAVPAGVQSPQSLMTDRALNVS